MARGIHPRKTAICFAVLFVFSLSAIGEEVFRLGVPSVENTPKELQEVVDRINSLMLKKHQIPVETIYLPWKRTLPSLRTGDVDGILRGKSTKVLEAVPGAIRVDPAVYYFEVGLYFLNDQRDKPINTLGIFLGSSEKKQVCANTECVLAQSEKQLIDLLIHRRIDAFRSLTVLIDPNNPLFIRHNIQFEVVRSGNLHLYLNKANRKYSSLFAEDIPASEQ